MSYQAYILDTMLQIVALADIYEYLRYEKVLNGVGSFELKASAQEPYTAYFDPTRTDMFLRVDVDGVPDFCGRILRPRFESGDGEFGAWTVGGPCLNSYLGIRPIIPVGITPPSDYVSGSYNYKSGAAEGVIKGYVNECLGTAAGAWNRPGYTVEAGTARGNTVTYYGWWDNLLDSVQKLAFAGGCDFDTTLNVSPTGTGILFQTFHPIRGTDHTVGNGSNAEILLTPDGGALGPYTYEQDASSVRNTLVIGGQGEYTARYFTQVVDADSVAKWGVMVDFLDARNSQDAGSVITEGQGQLTKVGQPKQTIETEVLDTGPYLYKRDWDLGDTVTISVPVGSTTVTVNKQITRVEVALEGGKLPAPKPTLGLPPEDLIDRLRRISRDVGLVGKQG